VCLFVWLTSAEKNWHCMEGTLVFVEEDWETTTTCISAFHSRNASVISTYVWERARVRVHVCVFIYLCGRVCMHDYVCMHAFVRVCVGLYICVCVCVYVIYIHIHTCISIMTEVIACR
jgi:hypothetical protein